MDLFFAILAGILLLLGFLGTFVPILPGAPLAWAGLLLAYFSAYCEISTVTLIITFIFAVLVSILDNILPVYLTNRLGGSKKATWGATIGVFVGFFIGPWGLILGPFAGAFIGELMNNNGQGGPALKTAFGAFLGFIFGTGMKMITVLAFVWVFIWGIIK